jgi:hypothetical protein
VIISRPLIIDGEYWGTVYTFEFAGDVFPVHTHETETDNHITVVTYGGITCQGHPDHEGAEVRAIPGASVIAWEVGKPHGFTSLEDGTTIVNMLKVRKPWNDEAQEA